MPRALSVSRCRRVLLPTVLALLAGCTGSPSGLAHLTGHVEVRHESAAPDEPATVASVASPAQSPRPTAVASRPTSSPSPVAPASPVASPVPSTDLTLAAPSPAASASPVAASSSVPTTGAELVAPAGVAIAPNGDMVVADRARHQLLRFTPDGQGAVMAGTGTAGYAADGADAASSPLSSPHAVRYDGDGNLYVVERNPALVPLDALDDTGKADNLCVPAATPASRVRRIDKNGKATTVYTADRQLILDLVATPGGFLFMALWDPCGGKGSVVMLPPGQSPVTIVDPAMGYRNITSLCFDADHNLYASADDQLLEYTDNQLAHVQLINNITMPAGPKDQAQLAEIGGGTLYIVERASNRIVRWTPWIGTVEIVAGTGGINYAGQGADDGIGAPCYPTFGPDGTLYFIDLAHRKVRQLGKLVLNLAITI